MMKIIQIMPEFGLAGAEIMCENLTYELLKAGNTVIVVSMYDYRSAITERMENAGIDIRYLGKKSGLDFSMIGKMKKIFKEEKPDAIHTHRYVMQYAIPAAILSKVKSRVHTVHNVAEKENGKLARKLNKFYYKFCGVVPVALSDLIKETIVKEYKIDKSKIPVILNGIDLSKCEPKSDYSMGDTFKILHIGRFSEQKNHKRLIEAFYLFIQKHPDSELNLIGDGELITEIKYMVQELGIQDKVRFLGLQSKVYPYLNNADVFVLTSDYEGIPMTLIEAMGTGMPIVATAVGGVPDMLKNGEDAILTNLNTEEISKAFLTYAQDEKLRKLHGEKAKEHSVLFSSQSMAQSYMEVYKWQTR